MTVTVHCINSFLDYDIDQKNPCEKDELLELRIQDQDNEPQRKQLNRKNYKDLEWVFHEHSAQYSSAHEVGKLPKTKKNNLKGVEETVVDVPTGPTKLEKKKSSQLTGYRIKHLESSLRQNWL